MTTEEQLMHVARQEANQSMKVVGWLVVAIIVIPVMCWFFRFPF